MKHLKEYNKFNEGFLGDEIKSIFTSDYDKFVKNLFNRIKETFNVDNLSYGETEKSSNNEYSYGFMYDLEETDSESGFIKITIIDNTFFAIPGYDLWIDDEEINCSFILKRSLYRFLNSKYNHKRKEIKKSDAQRLQKKYDV